MNPDIRAAIQQFIVKELKPPVTPDYDSPLIDQGIIDSLAIFLLIGFVSEEYGVEINVDEITFENFSTIDAIAKLVSDFNRK